MDERATFFFSCVPAAAVYLSVSLLILDKQSKDNFFIQKFLDIQIQCILGQSGPFMWLDTQMLCMSHIKFGKIVSVCIRCNANQKF